MGNPEDRFSREEAQLMLTVNKIVVNCLAINLNTQILDQ